jgi:phage tail sheath gpL-like
MTISFNTIPITLYTPGSYVEYDASRATQGLQAQPHDALLIGVKLATGSAVGGVIYTPRSPDEAAALFGPTSQLAQMVAAYRRKDSLTPLHCIALLDAALGVKATGKITASGTATEAGSTPLYIGGRRINVAVLKDMTAAEWETAALAACALDGDLPVVIVADAVGTGLGLTAVHAGPDGNGIQLAVCALPGERVPGGLTFAVTAMASGASAPKYSDAIALMSDDQYHTVALGTADPTEIGVIVEEMESRSDAFRQIEGVGFAVVYGAQPGLSSIGNGYNSNRLVLVGGEKAATLPTPWELAAEIAADAALQAQIHPARAYTGHTLPGCMAAPRGVRFTRAERNTLISDGVSTVIAASDGRLLIERLVTTYQTNAMGLPDSAFQDLSTLRTLDTLRYTLRARMAQKFSNFLLADDGSEVTGQPIATPKIIRGEVISWYIDCALAGLVEMGALDQFKAELLVERDLSDPNRVNVILPPDLMNNFLVGAYSLQFRR